MVLIKESNSDLRKRKIDYVTDWSLNPKVLKLNRAMEIKTGHSRDRRTSEDIFRGVYI